MIDLKYAACFSNHNKQKLALLESLSKIGHAKFTGCSNKAVCYKYSLYARNEIESLEEIQLNTARFEEVQKKFRKQKMQIDRELEESNYTLSLYKQFYLFQDSIEKLEITKEIKDKLHNIADDETTLRAITPEYISDFLEIEIKNIENGYYDEDDDD